jgi:hypothetical protein
LGDKLDLKKHSGDYNDPRISKYMNNLRHQMSILDVDKNYLVLLS